jgi:5-methyltetrahydrofolate--homocysteine methyltransferase
VQVFDDYDLSELRRYIDWQPFFNAWEMKGRFPDILNHPVSGEAARKLYEDGQEMLDTLIAEKWLKATGIMGIFPANVVGHDDIEVYASSDRADVLQTSPPSKRASRTTSGPSR